MSNARPITAEIARLGRLAQRLDAGLELERPRDEGAPRNRLSIEKTGAACRVGPNASPGVDFHLLVVARGVAGAVSKRLRQGGRS
jgi:hypothetical protein